MGMLLVSLFVFGLFMAIGLGWLIPLVIGLVKVSRQSGGKGWLMLAGVWGFSAFVIIGGGIYSVNSALRRAASETFNPASYTGAVATIVLPYAGSGTLSLRNVEQNKSWHISFSETNSVVVPAGLLRVWHISYDPDDEKGESAGSMSCALASDEDLVVKAGDVVTLPGGTPFTAALTVQAMEDNKIKIGYSLTDVAGNRITCWSSDPEKGGPKVEAIGPDGKSFWSAQLEYGWGGVCEYLGQIPKNAPATFILRPVQQASPFEIIVKETAWTNAVSSSGQ